MTPQRTYPYQRGDRIALQPPAAGPSGQRPAQPGTVLGLSPDLTRMVVAWDDGTSSILDAVGDLVEPHHSDQGWTATLRALGSAGTAAGRRTADWWAAATLGDLATTDPSGRDRLPAATTRPGTTQAEFTQPEGTQRAPGDEQQPRGRQPGTEESADLPAGGQVPDNQARGKDSVVAVARRILADLADHDAQRSAGDLLRALAPPSQTPATAPDWYQTAAGPGAPNWEELPPPDRDAATRIYLRAFDDALRAGVIGHCRITVGAPTGQRRNWSGIGPVPVATGDVGVFAHRGQKYRPARAGGDRFPVGYIGTLIGSSLRGAIVEYERDVIEAIVAGQQTALARMRDAFVEADVPDGEFDQWADPVWPRLSWDGEALVVGAPARIDGPDQRARIEPDAAGRYRLGGQSWDWTAVRPFQCDQIIGTVPTADLTPLVHSPELRVPDGRLRARTLPKVPRSEGTLYPALLECDGTLAAVLLLDGQLGVSWHPWSTFGAAELAAYARFCLRNGTPPTPTQVLLLLLEDDALASVLAEATEEGGTLARLRDPAGRVVTIESVWPAPRTLLAALRVGAQFATGHPDPVPACTWELWTGTGWLDVTPNLATQAARPGEPLVPGWLAEAQLPLPALDTLTGDQMVELAAVHGVLLSPDLTEAEIRTRLRVAVQPVADDTDGTQR